MRVPHYILSAFFALFLIMNASRFVDSLSWINLVVGAACGYVSLREFLSGAKA